MTKVGRMLLAGAVVGGIVVVIARTRARTAAQSPDTPGDIAPTGPAEQGELVDTAIEGSFPASDPPSYWGRDPDDS